MSDFIRGQLEGRISWSWAFREYKRRDNEWVKVN
jgi:hypothetical protein